MFYFIWGPNSKTYHFHLLEKESGLNCCIRVWWWQEKQLYPADWRWVVCSSLMATPSSTAPCSSQCLWSTCSKAAQWTQCPVLPFPASLPSVQIYSKLLFTRYSSWGNLICNFSLLTYPHFTSLLTPSLDLYYFSSNWRKKVHKFLGQTLFTALYIVAVISSAWLHAYMNLELWNGTIYTHDASSVWSFSQPILSDPEKSCVEQWFKRTSSQNSQRFCYWIEWEKNNRGKWKRMEKRGYRSLTESSWWCHGERSPHWLCGEINALRRTSCPLSWCDYSPRWVIPALNSSEKLEALLLWLKFWQ